VSYIEGATICDEGFPDRIAAPERLLLSSPTSFAFGRREYRGPCHGVKLPSVMALGGIVR
jgi:hypothetical protein